MSGEWLAVIHFPQLSQLAGRRTSPSSHECQFLGEGAEFHSNTKSAVYEGTEDKCEPVYTNCTACVALWPRPGKQRPIVRDLTANSDGSGNCICAMAMGPRGCWLNRHQAVLNNSLGS